MDQFEKEATKAAEEYIEGIQKKDPFLNKAISTMVGSVQNDSDVKEQMRIVMSMTIICVAKLAHDNELLKTQVMNLASLIEEQL